MDEKLEFHFTLLDTVITVDKAWQMVTIEVIYNCFHKAGFHTVESKIPFEDNIEEELGTIC